MVSIYSQQKSRQILRGHFVWESTHHYEKKIQYLTCRFAPVSMPLGLRSFHTIKRRWSLPPGNSQLKVKNPRQSTKGFFFGANQQCATNSIVVPCLWGCPRLVLLVQSGCFPRMSASSAWKHFFWRWNLRSSGAMIKQIISRQTIRNYNLRSFLVHSEYRSIQGNEYGGLVRRCMCVRVNCIS